jgi:prolactin regulatory element-binding protein
VAVLLVLELEIIAAKMGNRSRHLHCSKKYPVPLFSVAWLRIEGENEESEGTTTGGEHVVILGGGGGGGRTGVANLLLLVRYYVNKSVLSDAFHEVSTDNDPPYRMAALPGGEGFVCSLGNDCRLFTLKKAADDDGGTRISSDERRIEVLEGVGERNSLVFSADGTRLAAGGDDGYLRVFEWPSLKVSIDGTMCEICRSRRQQAGVCGGFLINKCVLGFFCLWSLFFTVRGFPLFHAC